MAVRLRLGAVGVLPEPSGIRLPYRVLAFAEDIALDTWNELNKPALEDVALQALIPQPGTSIRRLAN